MSSAVASGRHQCLAADTTLMRISQSERRGGRGTGMRCGSWRCDLLLGCAPSASSQTAALDRPSHEEEKEKAKGHRQRLRLKKEAAQETRLVLAMVTGKCDGGCIISRQTSLYVLLCLIRRCRLKRYVAPPPSGREYVITSCPTPGGNVLRVSRQISTDLVMGPASGENPILLLSLPCCGAVGLGASLFCLVLVASPSLALFNAQRFMTSLIKDACHLLPRSVERRWVRV